MTGQPYFYVGTHMPSWLADPRFARVPLFVSHRRLAHRRRLPAAAGRWALDSGGFSELTLYGQWRTTAADYVAAVLRYDQQIGNLDWAAPRDKMCEPVMLTRTGETILDHQRWTVADYIDLTRRWNDASDADSPFMPVLQGWLLRHYQRCVQLYGDAGVDLTTVPVVGVGSICRRQATAEIRDILTALAEQDLWLHGFGVKLDGLRNAGHLLASADSMAWSYSARRDKPTPGCHHGEAGAGNCANCPRYALAWRDRVLNATRRATPQLALNLAPGEVPAA